jgi:hypothetical protein
MFVFDNPREARIYERLRRLGEGPAAFWRDACFLNREPSVLITSAHLIGHALRETESAVRAVLRATFGIPKSDDKQNGHRIEIEAILVALGIPLDDPAAIAWLDTPGDTGMQAWAHRKNLGLRRPNDDLRRLWNSVVAFLDRALEVFDSASIRALDRLDALLQQDPPSKRTIRAFMEEVPKSVVVLDHFSERAPPSWLRPLRENGFMSEVPESSSLGEGDTMEQLRWPPSRYLLRLAREDQSLAEIADAALAVADRANPVVHIDLAEIALLVEPRAGARLAAHAAAWLDQNASYVLVDRLTKLSSRLLTNGQPDAGFALADVLTTVGSAE